MITHIVDIVFALDNDWIDVDDFQGNKNRYSVINDAREVLETMIVLPLKVKLDIDEYQNVYGIEYV